jgi:amino acid transporter
VLVEQSRTPGGPIGLPGFVAFAVVSFGGPLALAALYAPNILDDTSASAGLVAIAAAVVFGFPLLVWLRYSRQVATSGGLYGFVRAAAGPRVAMAQAVVWVFSYALYLIYTTASIVYDTLPAVTPGITPYQPYLEIAIPVALAAVMLAGRTVTLAVLGLLAIGQLALVAILATVAISHDHPASSFALQRPSHALASSTAQIALLYICGSLPLYLGGELKRPARTVRRGLLIGYGLTAVGVTVAVFPLAQNPAFTRAAIPGMSIVEVFSGRTLALVVGTGVAVSVAGVMLVEYFALTRLLHVLTRRSVRQMTRVLAVLLVVSAPFTLIDPEHFYDRLLKPSLVALWVSQLIVFVVYPRFARRVGRLRVTDVVIAAGGTLFALYGIWATLHHASS